jgi:hypothetical protein
MDPLPGPEAVHPESHVLRSLQTGAQPGAQKSALRRQRDAHPLQRGNRLVDCGGRFIGPLQEGDFRQAHQSEVDRGS